MIINTESNAVQYSVEYEQCVVSKVVTVKMEMVFPDTGPIYEYLFGVPDNIKIVYDGILMNSRLISYDISKGFIKAYFESNDIEFDPIGEAESSTMDISEFTSPAGAATKLIEKIHRIAYRNEMCGSEIVKLIEEYRNEKA